ncbi:restriction endonuclease subunit S [Winogradskyella sediminis]|uniref:restriction endonuclease subunit S n=1 Tax=Winogradskyella sediminis TaxID=1382466 RepID=UPI003AA7DBD8
MNKFRLKELLEIKNGRDYKHLKDGDIPVYGSGGFMRYVDKSLYEGKSILLPRKGTLSNIQYVNEPFWTVDTIYYSIVDEDKADPYYLYNYIKLLDLSRLNSGTGVPSMTFGAYYDVPIRLPNLNIQKKTAKVLSDLDAKIEVNNKINQELEAMAKKLYDYWFVQFDFPDANGKPYKSSDGKMVFNEELKREIPAGWNVGTLLDIATYVNGLACQKYKPLDESYLPVIKIREMKGGFTNDTEKVRPNVPDRIKVFDGDILFSWSASLEVIQWAGGNGALNQHIFKVTSKKYPKSYYYFELLNYLQHFKMIADLRKTTMGHITQDHLKQSRIVIPPNLIIQQLDEKLKPILDKQVVLQRENQKLSELRDWLLPMLMNGQVNVGEGYSEGERELGMVAEERISYKDK